MAEFLPPLNVTQTPTSTALAEQSVRTGDVVIAGNSSAGAAAPQPFNSLSSLAGPGLSATLPLIALAAITGLIAWRLLR